MPEGGPVAQGGDRGFVAEAHCGAWAAPAAREAGAIWDRGGRGGKGGPPRSGVLGRRDLVRRVGSHGVAREGQVVRRCSVVDDGDIAGVGSDARERE